MSSVNSNIIAKIRNLKIGYKSNHSTEKVVADQINTELRSGELVCLMGPNGSGKSTLIKTLAGMQPKLEGEISLFGTPLNQLSPKDLACKLSTVLTDRVTIGNLDVFTLVSFGRSPYTGWLGRLQGEDEKKVRWAIEATGLKPLSDRDISTLSDGERQKVMIARALAQDTDLILLDEPTAHLDLPNRVKIIRLLRSLTHKTGKGFLLSTHELDLALKAGDRAWLLDDKQQLFTGVPEDLVLNETFETVFHRENVDFDRKTGTFNLHDQNGKTIQINGDDIGTFWTKRALEREGFQVVESEDANYSVVVKKNGDGFEWMLKSTRDSPKKFSSVKDLLKMAGK